MGTLGGQPSGQAAEGSRGGARRRRERAKRSDARRVLWLTGLYQAGASHHTSNPPGGAAGSRELIAQIVALRAEIAELRSMVNCGRGAGRDTRTEVGTEVEEVSKCGWLAEPGQRKAVAVKVGEVVVDPGTGERACSSLASSRSRQHCTSDGPTPVEVQLVQPHSCGLAAGRPVRVNRSVFA